MAAFPIRSIVIVLVILLIEKGSGNHRPRPPIRPRPPVILPPTPGSNAVAECVARGDFLCRPTSGSVLTGLGAAALLPAATTCISYRLICDGIRQCPGGEDEARCPSSISAPSFGSTSTTYVTSTSTIDPPFVIDSTTSTSISTVITASFTSAINRGASTTINSGELVCISRTVLGGDTTFSSDVVVVRQSVSTVTASLSLALTCSPRAIIPSQATLAFSTMSIIG